MEKERKAEVTNLREELKQARRQLEIKQTSLDEIMTEHKKHLETIQNNNSEADPITRESSKTAPSPIIGFEGENSEPTPVNKVVAIVREEMTVLKKSFELRVLECDKQLVASRIASSRERKNWLAQITEERTAHGKRVSKLQSELDKLTAAEAQVAEEAAGKWTALLSKEREQNQKFMKEEL